MNDQSRERASPNPAAQAEPTVRADAGHAGLGAERRRLLLRGLGRAAAVGAAAVPIQSLSAGVPVGGPIRLCTVSGVQSTVGSGRTAGTTTECGGFVPGHFAMLSNWPGYDVGPPPRAVITRDLVTVNSQTTKFSDVFTASTDNTKILDLVQVVANQNTDNASWVAALLTAIKKDTQGLGPGNQHPPLGDLYFPYTPSQVVALYNDATKRAAALAFFRFYTQNQG